MFYRAVVQVVLLFGSDLWDMSEENGKGGGGNAFRITMEFHGEEVTENQ